MSYGLVGAYAIYFILVGIHGNSSKLAALVERDGRGFLPWILAILILRALYNVESLRPLIKPFIGLAALTFVLKNWDKVVSQINSLLPNNVQIPTTGQASGAGSALQPVAAPGSIVPSSTVQQPIQVGGGP
jgi:hypothetical protein